MCPEFGAILCGLGAAMHRVALSQLGASAWEGVRHSGWKFSILGAEQGYVETCRLFPSQKVATQVNKQIFCLEMGEHQVT